MRAIFLLEKYKKRSFKMFFGIEESPFNIDSSH